MVEWMCLLLISFQLSRNNLGCVIILCTADEWKAQYFSFILFKNTNFKRLIKWEILPFVRSFPITIILQIEKGNKKGFLFYRREN